MSSDATARYATAPMVPPDLTELVQWYDVAGEATCTRQEHIMDRESSDAGPCYDGIAIDVKDFMNTTGLLKSR